MERNKKTVEQFRHTIQVHKSEHKHAHLYVYIDIEPPRPTPRTWKIKKYVDQWILFFCFCCCLAGTFKKSENTTLSHTFLSVPLNTSENLAAYLESYLHIYT